MLNFINSWTSGLVVAVIIGRNYRNASSRKQ